MRDLGHGESFIQITVTDSTGGNAYGVNMIVFAGALTGDLGQFMKEYFGPAAEQLIAEAKQRAAQC